MALQATAPLTDLYEDDETAWLETMAELIAEGRSEDLDLVHLREYLSDMAIRDRREVDNRLTVLLAHLLKWMYQAEKRSGSWRKTIRLQQQKLRRHASKGVLRRHAETALVEAYADAIQLACDETELPPETFPDECPYTVEQLLNGNLLT